MHGSRACRCADDVFGGTHALEIEKHGFVRFAKDIMVTGDRRTDIHAVLHPSAEYVREYEASAFEVRLAAWLTLGAAAVGIGTGAGTGTALAVASSDASAALDADVAAYNAKRLRTSAEFDPIQSREGDIATMQAFSLISYFAGTAAAAAGTLLWIFGPDPNKYDASTSTGSYTERSLLAR